MNNHDLPRMVSLWLNDKEYRKESAKLLITLFGLLKGNLYIYQGEEISMTNAYFESIDKYKDVETLNKYNELYILYNKLVSKSLEIHIKQKEIRYRMNAYERYNWFLKTYPNLDNYIKDKDIASFLGISPITLCRLKNKKYNS